MQDIIPVKPHWLKVRLAVGSQFSHIRRVLRSHNLVTVCEESRCPNIAECWQNEGTATFMIMGDVCTRGCRFCNVKTAFPAAPLDANEPEKLAKAVKEIGLDYAVITSVDRDDLGDQGANHFAACITKVKETGAMVEVLTPDFQGNEKLIGIVANAGPDVFAHNVETVRRLQKKARDPRAGYEQSLHVLKTVKESHPEIATKSAIMVGIGETKEEVCETMKDLRAVGVNILTIGQYLRPSIWHLPVDRYVHPDEFKEYEDIGREIGFRYVAAGPFVRSSYRAGELFSNSNVEIRCVK